MPYKHTQVGYFIVMATLIGFLILLVLDALILLPIVIIFGVLFSTLTVTVEIDRVRFWFGPGFIHMQIPLTDIESCQAARSRCQSLGMHGWPGKGWFFNVSGPHSVELKIRSDGKYYIGTDEPEALEKAIRDAIHAELHRALKVD